jgi:hypothetical protein
MRVGGLPMGGREVDCPAVETIQVVAADGEPKENLRVADGSRVIEQDVCMGGLVHPVGWSPG